MKGIYKIKRSRTTTLNICGLDDKTSELVSFTEKTRVDILSTADIRWECKNMQKKSLQKCVLKWSGVGVNEQAKQGVGFFFAASKQCQMHHQFHIWLRENNNNVTNVDRVINHVKPAVCPM